MARSVPEWRGKTDDTPVPPRVRLRVLDRAAHRCDKCLRLIIAGMKWHCDHKVALVNEGENRESNLQVLCALCHLHKTAEDVAEKSRVVRKRLKHLGIRKAKGRPLPGTKASGLRKRINGRVEKR